jgi:uncharacterized protein
MSQPRVADPLEEGSARLAISQIFGAFMLRTISIAFLLTATLAGCASPTPVVTRESPPEATPEPVSTVTMAPDTRFASCSLLTIIGEDANAPYNLDEEPSLVEHRLIAEVPSNPHEMLQGLQGRKDLHPDTAMLLEFDGDQNPVLWMKDTPASLDMIFADAEGQVFHLEAGTEPDSTRFLTPEEPEPIATHVLQLPAGRAESYGIFPGLSQMKIDEPAPCASFRGPVIAL